MTDWTGTEDTARGPWLETHTGRQFHPLDPRPEDVHLEDIAWHLSRIARFNGATDVPVNVAEHSLRVYREYETAYDVHPAELLGVLLHDAAEAYIGDIPRPVKRAFEKMAPGVLKQIELTILDAIYEHFDCKYPDANCLRIADNKALIYEKTAYWPNSKHEWPGLEKVEVPVFRPIELNWTQAYRSFVSEVEFLRRQRR